jgi:uncharacterized repeat protein (TIGR01451 family)
MMWRHHRNMKVCCLAAAGTVFGLPAGLASAAPLTIVKAFSTISDPQRNLLPKAIPGAEIDYTITITNPAANVFSNVSCVTFEDAIPARTMIRVADLQLVSRGPIEVLDGSLLGTGLIGSNLTYTYRGLGDTTDSLDFSADNGRTWDYLPVDQGGGYDQRVTNLRIRLAGNQAPSSTIRIRFRVQLL